MNQQELGDRLIEWYDVEGRVLPWRETTDAYLILVSEIMLQQTQVERVKIYYARWIERFPNWRALADATDGEVIEMWAGLGYNRRALSLRDIARQVVETGLPETREEWLALKGVGPYTSAALSVFSLRLRALPIDTNIRRVLGRVMLNIPFPDPKDDAEIEEVAMDLMDHERFYDLPQAIFDLATAHCSKNPDCASCPMVDMCPMADAFLSGEIEVPKRTVKKSKETVRAGKKHPDRIFRGRILTALREHGALNDLHVLGREIDKTYKKQDEAWVLAMLDRLAKDRLIVKRADVWRLPD